MTIHKQMAVLDNKDNNYNMLKILTSTTHFSLANKHLLQKIKPALCSLIKNDFYTTQIPLNKQNLPHLPVPNLEDTIKKFLLTVTPLLTPEELKKTTTIAHDFIKPGGVGEKLQKLLKEREKRLENWLEDWWLSAAYLGYRISVVVNSSPGLALPISIKFKNDEERIDFAARFITVVMQYKDMVDNDKIPVDKMGKDPLDMNQYKKFFGTCRIPKPKVDGLEFNPNSNYIVVACNNHFYKLPVLDSNNKVPSIQNLKNELKKIMSECVKPVEPVGILSSDHRDIWAETYKLLISDPINSKSVDVIQKSLVLLCLDKEVPSSFGDRLNISGHQCIHGGGAALNGGNRWFDKTVQFILGPDGITGMTYEHSPSEGQPIAVMSDFIFDNLGKVKGGSGGENVTAEKLKFNISPQLKNAIEKSSVNLDNLVSNFDLKCNVYRKYGKNFIKKQKMSPDSYLQMAMQYAYYKMYLKPAAHYESAATRKYIGGRTETIRSCSIESVKFAKGMLDKNATPMEKKRLLMDAVNSHKKYTVEALNGFGVDRHFLGLKLTALENNIPIHEIFTDKGLVRSQHFNLSTSQVALKCAGFMCYGAVFNDGYGFCYNPRDDEILYGIGSFKIDPSTHSTNFAEVFNSALDDMHDVCTKAPAAKL